MTTHHPESPTPQTATLSNGLQVIVQHTNDSVVYCGYVLRIGTRSEPPGRYPCPSSLSPRRRARTFSAVSCLRTRALVAPSIMRSCMASAA